MQISTRINKSKTAMLSTQLEFSEAAAMVSKILSQSFLTQFYLFDLFVFSLIKLILQLYRITKEIKMNYTHPLKE